MLHSKQSLLTFLSTYKMGRDHPCHIYGCAKRSKKKKEKEKKTNPLLLKSELQNIQNNSQYHQYKQKKSRLGNNPLKFLLIDFEFGAISIVDYI